MRELWLLTYVWFHTANASPEGTSVRSLSDSAASSNSTSVAPVNDSSASSTSTSVSSTSDSSDSSYSTSVASTSDESSGTTLVNPISEGCQPSVHIFFNPASGGNKGADLAKAMLSSMAIRVDESTDVKVSIWDIREGSPGKKPGFTTIRDMLDSQHCETEPPATRVIAAGGDGTVMWVISEAMAHNITRSNVVFGTIPFGTGNDYSHAFGWGRGIHGRLMTHNMKRLRQLVSQWALAEVVSHDIWRVTIAVKPTGGRVLSWSKKALTPQKLDPQKHEFVKMMSNYFSIGTESKVGLEFDKRRTKSKGLNKLVYAFEGMKTAVASSRKVGDLIESCTEEGEILFTSGNASRSPALNGNPSSIIFLNINSFAGGLDPWPRASPDGLLKEPVKKVFVDQATGDGKLEVLTYQTLGKLGGEQLKKRGAKGNGQRVSQSHGPFVIRFKPTADQGRVYMQVDGEYYAVEHPISVSVEHVETVKVLKRAGKKRRHDKQKKEH